jgi:hypothetical protein
LNFSANANGHVLALALDGDTLYAGGEFDEISGNHQRWIAALNAKTGALKPWNPEPTGSVRAIAVTNSTVYLGGNFEYVGGRYRNRLAAVDKESGLALPWNPDASDSVSQLLIADGKLFVVGSYSIISGQARNGLAAFDLATGGLDAFNSNALGGARSLAFDEGVLYVAGAFGLYSVAIQPAGVTLPAVQLNGAVNSVAVLGEKVYLAGEFSSVNGVGRNKVAAIDRRTGSVSSLDLNPSGRFDLVSRVGDKVLGAGTLGLIKVPRRGLAAIDTASGFATAWNPDCDGTVYSLATASGQLYVGGQFETLGGARRISIGSVGLQSGKVSPWRPNTVPQSTIIYAMALLPDTILAGGYVTVIDGQERGNIAELSLRTGDPTPWNPQADDFVHAIIVDGERVYIGGDFKRVSNLPRSGLAALNRFTGKPLAWNPGADGRVRGIVLSGKTLYASGGFQTLGGAPRSYLGAVDAVNGTAVPWICNMDAVAQSMQKVGDTLYIGGQFTVVNGAPRINAAAVHAGLPTANVLPWDPRPGNDSSVVFSLIASQSSIFMGGRFNTVGAAVANYLAVFDYPTRLENPLKLPGGIFRLNFYGPIGFYYIFEKSSDLKNWTPILTNRPPFIFEDVSGLTEQLQFYRARPLN